MKIVEVTRDQRVVLKFLSEGFNQGVVQKIHRENLTITIPSQGYRNISNFTIVNKDLGFSEITIKLYFDDLKAISNQSLVCSKF